MKITACHCRGWVLLVQETLHNSTYDFLTLQSARELLSQLEQATTQLEKFLDTDIQNIEPCALRIGGRAAV